MENSIFKNSNTLVNEIVGKVENDNNGDLEVLDTIFKDYIEFVLRQTFLEGNEVATNIPEWVTVAKGQIDVLETCTE